MPDEPAVYYFGAAAGGVWKTEDAGSTWAPLFDRAGSASVGALAIAPSDPKVIYVGTGQIQARYDIASGDGVYKTTDGGKTWTHVGLAATRAIGRILVDPRDANVAIVAALGHMFGPNRERGIYRTEDGGKTWNQVLFVDDGTGGADLAADPENPVDPVRLALGGAQLPVAVVLPTDGGLGERPLQIDRRRKDLEADLRRKMAGGEPRTHRTRCVSRRARLGSPWTPRRPPNREEEGVSPSPGCIAPTTAARRGRASTRRRASDRAT